MGLLLRSTLLHFFVILFIAVEIVTGIGLILGFMARFFALFFRLLFRVVIYIGKLKRLCIVLGVILFLFSVFFYDDYLGAVYSLLSARTSPQKYHL